MSVKDTPARSAAAEERMRFWRGSSPWERAVLVEFHVGSKGKVTSFLWGDFPVIQKGRTYWRENASGKLKTLEALLFKEWVVCSLWDRSDEAFLDVGLPQGHYQLWVHESDEICVVRYPPACGDAYKQQLDKVIKACEQVRDALHQQDEDFSSLIRLHHNSMTRGQGSQHVRNVSATCDRAGTDRYRAFLRRRHGWTSRRRRQPDADWV